MTELTDLFFPGGLEGRESSGRARFDPWSRAWPPTPAFLPGESHGQRGLVGYSKWTHKESDTPELLMLEETQL